MNNATLKKFYFYNNYIVTASDLTNLQEWIFQTVGNLAAGFSPNNTVLNGLDVTSVSGLVVTVASGAAINQSGQIGVLTSATPVSIASPAGNPANSLVVLRPKTTDQDFITDPSNPFSGNTVPLDRLLGCDVVVLNGTPAVSPSYPTPLSTDIVLMGIKLSTAATGIAASGIDSSQRKIFVADKYNADAYGLKVTSVGANSISNSRTRVVTTDGSNPGLGGVVISPSSSTFSTSSSSPVPVTNLSVSLTTSGRPVRISIEPDGAGLGASSSLSAQGSGSSAGIVTCTLIINRDGTNIFQTDLDIQASANGGTNILYLISPLGFGKTDVVAAGTHTYTATLQTTSTLAAKSASLANAVMVAYEL
jgi:hypothetical protein